MTALQLPLDKRICQSLWIESLLSAIPIIKAPLFREAFRSKNVAFLRNFSVEGLTPLADAFQEAKGDPSLWHDPHFAAYGHTRNSYTNANSHPTIFDYIFLRKSTMDPGEIWVKSFSLPDLHIVKPATQTQISISDHEGVASHIYLWKQ